MSPPLKPFVIFINTLSIERHDNFINCLILLLLSLSFPITSGNNEATRHFTSSGCYCMKCFIRTFCAILARSTQICKLHQQSDYAAYLSHQTGPWCQHVIGIRWISSGSVANQHQMKPAEQDNICMQRITYSHFFSVYHGFCSMQSVKLIYWQKGCFWSATRV